jgi:hypothetical protein
MHPGEAANFLYDVLGQRHINQFTLSHLILFKICFNTTLPYTEYFPSGPFPSGIPIKILYSLMFLPIRATRPAHPP